MNLRPIGVVRSEIADRKLMPVFGAPATVEVVPEFAAGLHRIEKHSHLWVLAWLDGSARDVLMVTPRGVNDTSSEGLHGVFSVRSPTRPNPIGLTAARVLRLDGPRIELDRLDFVSGTPVIDLKPYFVTRDLIFSAANAQVGRPASREAVRESLLAQALSFHGEMHGDLALAVRVLEHFRSEVLAMTDPPLWRIAAPLARPVMIDALMGMTRATPGRGSLRFHEDEAVEFRHGGVSYYYALRARGAPSEILAAADEELFRWTART
jgi:tRNA-Thr(GGU) m(6)t(6)A37 methyltransferase TsaA